MAKLTEAQIKELENLARAAQHEANKGEFTQKELMDFHTFLESIRNPSQFWRLTLEHSRRIAEDLTRKVRDRKRFHEEDARKGRASSGQESSGDSMSSEEVAIKKLEEIAREGGFEGFASNVDIKELEELGREAQHEANKVELSQREQMNLHKILESIPNPSPFIQKVLHLSRRREEEMNREVRRLKGFPEDDSRKRRASSEQQSSGESMNSGQQSSEQNDQNAEQRSSKKTRFWFGYK